MKTSKRGVVVCAILILCLAMTGFSAAKPPGAEGERKMADSKIRSVLERHRDELMAIPGVVGFAEGRCNGISCIKVYVTGKRSEIAGKIPSRLEGFPVNVEETGEFKPVPEKED
ncbi:MAG: hypothetical protein P8Y63_08625 [Deltaproteobacteria bacterium]|jgi:hypothetical protein